MTKNKNFDQIHERIKNLELKNKESEGGGTPSNIGVGLKISLDLISPIIVGCIIGLGIDNFFSSKPIFFLIFLLLGVVAGFLNIYRYMKKLR